jgi:glucosamine kinase
MQLAVSHATSKGLAHCTSMFGEAKRAGTCVRTSPMPYYLGIDGGGTKTRCVLGDADVVLATAMSGGSNIVRHGERQAREALRTVIEQVCAAARISPGQVSAICVGAAGAARPEIADAMRGIVAKAIPELPPTRIDIVGDTEIALESAFGNGPGVIAIAGTGSIVYGRAADGRTARAGGWGFAISDEGSGHWIGRRAISAILSARDQGIDTALTALVSQEWKLSTLDALVQFSNSTPPPEFPRLFPVVLRAAIGGDSIAQSILSDAGAKLAELAVVVVRRLGGGQSVTPLPIAMTGSVFRQSAEVRQVFYNGLLTVFPRIEVRQDQVDPAVGALARARAMSNEQ